MHAGQLHEKLFADIPLTRAMGLRVSSYDGDCLRLSAPLAPNVNDKGCAFGGSLASALTLAGWGLVMLKLQSSNQDFDVYVQDSKIAYLAPIWADIHVEARLPADGSWEDFHATLAARGRARLKVHCRSLLADGSEACTLQARFVAMARRSVAA